MNPGYVVIIYDGHKLTLTKINDVQFNQQQSCYVYLHAVADIDALHFDKKQYSSNMIEEAIDEAHQIAKNNASKLGSGLQMEQCGLP